MTRNKAIAALKAGHMISHKSFHKHEYVRMFNGKLLDEDGNELDFKEFWLIRNGYSWNNDWFTYNPINQYPILKLLLECSVFEGCDASTLTVDGFTPEEWDLMDKAATKHFKFLFNGFPFPGESEQYDKMIKEEKGVRLIQKLIDQNDN